MENKKIKTANSLPMDKKDINPVASLLIHKEDIKSATSASTDKEDTKPATSLLMDKEDSKSATSLPMDKEIKSANLIPCVSCLRLPGTKTDFSNVFNEMSSYVCSKCGEKRAMFEVSSDGSSTNSYVGSDEEDHGSDTGLYYNYYSEF